MRNEKWRCNVVRYRFYHKSKVSSIDFPPHLSFASQMPPCGAVQIFDLGNSAHARDAREGERKARTLNGCGLLLSLEGKVAFAKQMTDEVEYLYRPVIYCRMRWKTSIAQFRIVECGGIPIEAIFILAERAAWPLPSHRQGWRFLPACDILCTGNISFCARRPGKRGGPAVSDSLLRRPLSQNPGGSPCRAGGGGRVKYSRWRIVP